jgi:hypothetical protein
MSESGDYTPMVWRDHDFKSARAHYDKHVGRSYADAVAVGKTANDLLPNKLETMSTSPLVVIVDETGSMGEWPKTIFSKLPYLYNEASSEYLGKDVEISFGAIGDAYCNETYSTQARPFDKGPELKKRLEELVIEKGGGGQMMETYELAALYYARNVNMPKAVRPIIIFIGDEYPYDQIPKDKAAAVHVNIQGRMISTADVFAELKAKFDVYLILKPYDPSGSDDNENNKKVRQEWLKYVDLDHIAYLGDPTRVVDVIFGILAKETGKVDYFKKEIGERQKPGQIDTVYKALKTIHRLPAGDPKKAVVKAEPGKSTMFRRNGAAGKKTGDLL